tara:strand:- start:1301 stop:1792 length:492 start_codon:yes stop_codon:yes gene_type:complete
MSQNSNTQYFCNVTAISDNKEDRSGNPYRTVSLSAVQVVTRHNPITGQDETMAAGSAKTTNVNAWGSGVDSPWNHLFNAKVADPVLATPIQCDVEPYEIDGNEYTRATFWVPDAMDSSTWAQSLNRVVRWDNRTLAGEIILPIDVVEATGEVIETKTKATLDV